MSYCIKPVNNGWQLRDEVGCIVHAKHMTTRSNVKKAICSNRNVQESCGFAKACCSFLPLSPTWISINIILTSKVSSHHHKSPCMKALRSSLQCGFGLPETQKERETRKVIQSSCCMEPVFKCFFLLAFLLLIYLEGLNRTQNRST